MIEKVNVGYQFIAVPQNLWSCCDLNCKSLLTTLVQLSGYYADEDGWFFRTNEDLRAESDLGEKVVRACLSTFHKIGILEVKCIGKSNGKTPNYFKLNIDRFAQWESISLEDCMKNPQYKIETEDYKAKGWTASYLTNDSSFEVQQSVQSADNIDNIENTDNKENKLSEGSKRVEARSNQFDVYKKQEDYLMDKLYNVSTWTDFHLFRKKIKELISTASSEKVAEKTRARYKKIEEGKIKFLKSIISKQPYNSFYDDFYREYDCGWLGKDNKQNAVQPQPKKKEEEDPKADLREIFRMNGWGDPDISKYEKQEQEGQDFSPIDDDNLPF